MSKEQPEGKQAFNQAFVGNALTSCNTPRRHVFSIFVHLVISRGTIHKPLYLFSQVYVERLYYIIRDCNGATNHLHRDAMSSRLRVPAGRQRRDVPR